MANSAAIIAVLLVGLRPWIPAFFTIVVGNYALMGCFILIYLTAARVVEQPARLVPWFSALCSVTLPAFSYYTFTVPIW